LYHPDEAFFTVRALPRILVTTQKVVTIEMKFWEIIFFARRSTVGLKVEAPTGLLR
jgi:hypothetical protein